MVDHRIDIVRSRLSNHGLTGRAWDRPHAAVAHLLAAQAQDFPAAKWSVGVRTRGATDAAVERAFNEGAILRTHVLRPTWHVVTPPDIRWLLALTGPRVQVGNARRYRDLGLDARLLARGLRVIARALAGGAALTRAELAERLRGGGIRAEGARLAYILMHAELDGLIASGPRRGKQFTYALLDDRAPPARGAFDRDAALAELARRYLRSHGPAQAQDLAWWAGLTLSETRRALELAGPSLASERIDGTTYWVAPQPPAPRSAGDGRGEPEAATGPRAWLLSIFDEYAIAYRDRSAIAEGGRLERLLSMGAAMTSVLVLDGRIAGTWKRAVAPRRLEIAVSPFRALRRPEREAVDAAARAYAAFLEVPEAAVTIAR